MAKYIKQEMADLNGKGQTQAYYRLLTNQHMTYEQFVEQCTLHGGMARGAVVGVMAHVVHELMLQLAHGNSVTIDGLGTFRAGIGVCEDKNQDGFAEGEPTRNAVSLQVTSISYQADKELILDVDRHCTLERGGISRLRHSKFTPEQRVQVAVEFLSENHFMRVADYVSLTGLSAAGAARELRQLADDPASPIMAKGTRSHLVYVLRQE